MHTQELPERLLEAWVALSGTMKSSKITEDLTYNQAVVMKLVYDQYRADGVGRTAVGHIVQQTRMQKSLVNRTVNSLCQLGYLRRERGTEDARTLFVCPEEQRLQDFLAVHRRSLQLAQTVIDRIGPEDAQRFVEMCRKLLDSGFQL